MTSYIHVFLGLILLSYPHSARAQGYTIEGNRIVVEGEEQWKQWSYPKGILSFRDDGSLHPIYLRKNINACLNAQDFSYGPDKEIRGGISDARSNPKDAAHVIDGDLSTYWEPDTEDPPRDWWMEIDLGRVVYAERIVLCFAEGADPFLGFQVLTWSGEIQIEHRNKENWVKVGVVLNTDLDDHTFELRITDKWDNMWVQYIRLFVLSTRGDEAKEVSKEEYASLDPDLQGAVMYYRITPTGEQEWLDKEGYEKLAPEQKGPIRYYRREVPRLAEVEVRALGDNVCLGVVERGGAIDHYSMIDGIYMTGAPPSTASLATEAQMQMDLGTSFWLDTVKMIFGQSFQLPEVRVLGSGGAKAADGSLIWRNVALDSEAKHKMRFVRFDFVKETLRLESGGVQGAGWKRVMEIQLYGEGYVPEVEMVSPVIEVGEQRNLTSLRWNAEIASGTNVEIRTRTGNTLSEEIHYFDKGGREVTGHEYHKLPFFKQGEKVIRMVPGGNWSMWSYPYAYPEDRISSPTPRTYLQIQARLLSDDPDVYATLRSVEVLFSSPLAQQIVGEVHPIRAEREGKSEDFSFYLQPSFISSNMGFDEILVYSPSHVGIHLQSLHIGTAEEYVEGREDIFAPEELDLRPTGSDSVWIQLPYPILPEGKGLIRIDFSSVIYLNGTVFEATVVHSSSPGSPQRVDEGDATELVRSEQMTVFVPVEARVIGDIEISPNPFTPNEDGINDEVQMEFSVFKVYVSVPVWIEVWDLNGRRIRRIGRQREVSSGKYSIPWDGRDEEGRMVNPGVYMVRIEVKDMSEEDVEDVVVMRTVGVVY